MLRHYGKWAALALLLIAGCSSGHSSNKPAHHMEAGPDATADAGTDAPADGAPDVTEASAPATTQGSCGAATWAAVYGASKPGSLSTEAARSVAAENTGAIVLAGSYYGDADFGGGPLVAGKDNRSMFVVKLDASKQHVWSRGFGDPGSGLLYAPQATGTSVALSSSRVVVAGSFAGTIDFGKGAVSSTESTGSLDGGLDGGLGLDGGFGGCLLTCAPDAVVLSLDAATGATQWVRAFGDTDGDAAEAVVGDGGGNVFVTGTFRGTVDFGKGPVTSAGGADIFVLKLDVDGNTLWVKTFGGAKDDAGTAVTPDNAGGVVVGGSYTTGADLGSGPETAQGDYDGFLVDLDANGNILWRRTLGASSRGSVLSLAGIAQTYYAAGSLRGGVTLAGQQLTTAYNDALVLAVDSGGNEKWAKLFGTHDNDAAQGIAADNTGRIIVTGTLGYGLVDLGGGPLATNLSDSAFVLELDAQGNHVCSRRFPAEPTGEQISDAVSLGARSDGLAVALDGAGNTLFAGSLTGQSDFGTGTIKSSGGSDIFAVSFSP